MKLSIHKFTAADLGPVAQMMTALYDYGNGYPLMNENELERLMFTLLESMYHPHVVYLIAYDGKKPAGFFMGHLAQRRFGKPSVVGVCDELYVVPEKRGSLVGLKLIKEAVKLALLGGAEGVEAVAGYGKTDQRWMRLGFRPYVTHLYMPIDEAKATFLDRHEANVAIPSAPTTQLEEHNGTTG